ncbi:GQ67_03376T0 [Komagataella phaffii]|nr:GQ67_03376T0 [Komagataella phaffii]AOA68229.1 GQ68_03345T0 [Komagataella phaffii GS115]
MRSIIFSNYSAFDTRRLGATIDVEHSNLRFLNNMTLNLWDCGGQDVFIENFLNTSSQNPNSNNNIFKKCEVLLHVFDVESKEVNKDIEIFQRVLKNLHQFSPNVKVFILLHKMDLIQVNKRDELFKIMFDNLQKIANPFHFKLTGFATSIWDESLYKAWSSIICSLIPNISFYQQNLSKINDILNAREIILFEKTTFLVISSTDRKLITNNDELDPKRFEKISNIIKTYKQSVNKIRTNFETIILNGMNTSIYLAELTNNIFIMIVMDNQRNDDDSTAIEDENLILEDIKIARSLFEKVENV